MASIAKVAAVGRLKVPQAFGATLVVKRDKSVSLTPGNYKRGTGGRSSFSGIVATVFGATGSLGHSTINRLGKIGSQIIVPYRCDAYQIKDIPLMGDLGQILFNKFDLRDDASIEKVVQYSNVVINLIGRDYETKNYSFEDIYIDGPRRLARAAREAGVERFIHVSHLNAPVQSSNILQNGSRSLKAKYIGEQAVMEEFPDATIVRPSDVMNEYSGWLNMYNMGYCSLKSFRFSSLRISRYYPLWNGGHDVHKMPLKITDFTKGIEAIIKNKETKGKIYQFVGPTAYSLHDLLEFVNGAKLAYNYKYIKDFMLMLALAKVQTDFYKKFRVKVPKISPDRLEKETISDRLDEHLPTLEDLGVKPENVEQYIQYLLRPAIDVNKLVEEFGQVPQPPKPQAAYYTSRAEALTRRLALQ